jgi:hypothetical protein
MEGMRGIYILIYMSKLTEISIAAVKIQTGFDNGDSLRTKKEVLMPIRLQVGLLMSKTTFVPF